MEAFEPKLVISDYILYLVNQLRLRGLYMDIYFSTETNYKNRLSKASRKIKSRNDLSIRYSEQNV